MTAGVFEKYIVQLPKQDVRPILHEYFDLKWQLPAEWCELVKLETWCTGSDAGFFGARILQDLSLMADNGPYFQIHLCLTKPTSL
jgi:hypothetical protein